MGCRSQGLALLLFCLGGTIACGASTPLSAPDPPGVTAPVVIEPVVTSPDAAFTPCNEVPATALEYGSGSEPPGRAPTPAPVTGLCPVTPQDSPRYPLREPTKTTPPLLPDFYEKFEVAGLLLEPTWDEGTSAQWLREPGWYMRYWVYQPGSNPRFLGFIEITDERSERSPTTLDDAIDRGRGFGVNNPKRTQMLPSGQQLLATSPDEQGFNAGSVEARLAAGRKVWILIRCSKENLPRLAGLDLSEIVGSK